MTPATALTNQIRAATSKLGARLFNTHVGKFWAGRMVGSLPNGDTILRNARIVNVGVKGQSDLNGWIPVVVTPEMVGTTVAIRVEIEVKTTDRPSPEQIAWIEAVKKSGGRAGIARTAAEAASICLGQAGE